MTTREAFLINPAKKVRRKTKVIKRKANTVKKKRRITTAKKKMRPVVYKTGARTYSRSRFSKSKKAGISINPMGEEVLIVGANPRKKKRCSAPVRRKKRKRSYKRNPAVLSGGINLTKPMTLLMPIMIGIGAKMATERIPTMVNIVSPLPKFGVQAALAIGGGILLQKPLGKTNATIWAIVSGVTALGDLLSTYVFKQALGYVSDVPVVDYESPEQIDYDTVDAFPEDSGAYPYEGTVEY